MTLLAAEPWQNRPLFGTITIGDVVDVGVFLLALIVGAAIIYRIGRTVIRRAAVPGHVLGDEARARAETARGLLLSVWKYVVFLGVGIVLVSRLRGGLAPTVAVTSAVGLTIAFGAQWLFKDVIAGFSILMEGQVAVGDRVRLYGVETEGTVEAVGLRITVIRDDDGSRIFVPNGSITAIRNMGTVTAAAAEEARRTRTRRGGRGRGGGDGTRRAEEPAAATAAPPRQRREQQQRTQEAVSVTVPDETPAHSSDTPSRPADPPTEPARPEPIFELAGSPRAGDEDAEQERTAGPPRPRTRRGGRGRPRRPSRRPTTGGPDDADGNGDAGRDGGRDGGGDGDVPPSDAPAEAPPPATSTEPRDVLEESPWSIE